MFNGPNPFAEDAPAGRTVEKLPHVSDQKERDAVMRQGFAADKVPQNLDAIVVGSGPGALSAAALLSKAGKKVLVLEQHDRAGGGCHVFTEHGYERNRLQ